MRRKCQGCSKSQKEVGRLQRTDVKEMNKRPMLCKSCRQKAGIIGRTPMVGDVFDVGQQLGIAQRT